MGFWDTIKTKEQPKTPSDIPFVFPNMSTGGATTPTGLPEFKGFSVPAPEGQAPKVLEDTTISQGVPDKKQGFFAPVFEGLFGKKDAAHELAPEGTDKGLVGFIAPFMSKTEAEKVMPLYQSLVDKGIDTKRATDLAVKATRGETGATSEGLTWGERKAIALAQAKNSAGIALDVVSNIPGIGFMGKVANKADDAFRIIAKSQDAGQIARELEKVVPDVADNTLAKQLVDVTDKREVKQIVDDAIATRAEQLAEARKYATVEEYKASVTDPKMEPYVTTLRGAEKDLRRAERQGPDELPQAIEKQQQALVDFYGAAEKYTSSKAEYERLLSYTKQTSTEVDGGVKELIPTYGDKSQLTSIYTKAHEVPFRKGTSEAFQQAEAETVIEMLDLSEAGYRFRTENFETVGVSSTFPKWVPEDLRSRELFDKAVQHYEAGTRPATSATRVNELIDVMQTEIKERAVAYGDTEINVRPTSPDPVPVEGNQNEVLGGTSDTPKSTQVSDQKLRDTLSLSKSVPQKMKAVFTNIVEYVQNSEKRVFDLMGKKDLNLATNPYEIMTLYHGKIGDKIERGYAKVEEIVEDIISVTGRNKTEITVGRQEVNDYLQALHAPERNAALGDGAAGMTNEEASSIVQKASPEVKAIAEKARVLNEETLDLLKESGVISPELHTTLRTKYKNHVPLQRVMDTEDDIGDALSGRGFNVKTTGIKSAKGSDREVTDILMNITNNYEQAVLRSEKNIVDRATLAFVRNNEETLGHVMWERKPRKVGDAFDGKPLMERTQDTTVLQLFENGKPIWIQFKDEKLAIAFSGVGKEKNGVLLNAIGAFTRFYSGLATRFNPEFALPNKIRDMQETMTYLASQGDIGFRSAAKTALRDPASVKAVADTLRGADTAGAKLYAEMKAGGGTTGGMGLSTRKQTQMNIDQIFKTARSRPRQAAHKLVEYVDNWNTIFEDSTRLSVYKTALEKGATKERAAFLAKEASINFNRSGNGGPIINALWMFSNASIQGSTKMIRAMKNPKVAASVALAMGTSVAAVSEWNDKVDTSWRDKVTKWDRMNGLPILLPTEDGSTKYVVIPISWGLKPILTMMNAGYDAVSGMDIDPVETVSKVLSSVLDAYNPVGGTDLTSALIPTIGDVPVEVARNEGWSGSLIRPIAYNNEPKDIQYFQSLKDTEQGRLAIGATKKLQESTGILMSPADINYVMEQYMGGAGRSIKKTSELLFGITTDAPTPPTDEWPMVSRFLRMRTSEETGQGAGGETEKLKESLSEQARDRFRLNEEAVDTFKEMSELPKEVAAARFEVLQETNPALAEKIIEVAKDDAKGLTYTDRLVKALGVENGERARYIFAEFQKEKTQEAKAALWTEYEAKGLISKDVSAQLKYLLNQ